MGEVVTIHKLRIEREIEHHADHNLATFRIPGNKALCIAVAKAPGGKLISLPPCGLTMTMEEASTLSVAIQMAIDWLAGEP